MFWLPATKWRYWYWRVQRDRHALDLGIVVHGFALFLLSSFLWGSIAVKRKPRLAVAQRPNR